jgi:hypothetical protein
MHGNLHRQPRFLRSSTWLRAICYPIPMLLAAVSPRAQSGPTTFRVSVDDPRPVARAVQFIEARYGIPISYEDPTLTYEGDIVDKTVRFDLGRRALYPRGGQLDVLTTSPHDDPLPALLQVLQAHAASGGAGQFRVLLDAGMINVVPRRTRDANGDWIDDHPLLDTPLRLAPQSVNGAQGVQMICSSIADATGRVVRVGTIPDNFLAQHNIQLEGKGEPARRVLLDVIQQLDRKLSWRLFSDGNGVSALNIHIVSSPKS